MIWVMLGASRILWKMRPTFCNVRGKGEVCYGADDKEF